MRIKQLGNAGGLNFRDVSSAFLVELEPKKFVLVDCGHGVLQKAVDSIEELYDVDDKEAIRMIDCLCLTHTHFDHIADFESLAYYNYFVLRRKLNVYATENVLNDLNRIKPQKTKVFVDCQVKATELYTPIKHSNYIVAFETNHVVCPSDGFSIFNDKTRNVVIISGDTKAMKSIENTYELYEQAEYNVVKVFHDLSNFNNACNNVHTTKHEIETIYSDYFRSKLTFYHTDSKDFDNSWFEF